MALQLYIKEKNMLRERVLILTDAFIQSGSTLIERKVALEHFWIKLRSPW